MSGKKRSTDTIAAMLSSAPALVPVRDEPTAGPAESSPQPTAADHPSAVMAPSPLRPAAPVHPSQLPPPAEDGDFDDTDLESFELQADAPLVRPRRREQKDYQTVRINRPTAKILRAQWLLARQVDPLMSYTEFSTIVVQRGLQALKAQRDRGD
jgi:hypothetical protein